VTHSTSYYNTTRGISNTSG